MMAAWSFDLLAKIHNVLRDELHLIPDYRTDYVSFGATGRDGKLKVYYGPDSAKMGPPPRIDVVHFRYPGIVCHRNPGWPDRYPIVKGEVNLAGNEAEALQEVRRAGQFLRDDG